MATLMALTHIKFTTGLLMKDGSKIVLGQDAKILKNIAFLGGVASTNKGEQLTVIMELQLQNLTSPAPETLFVAIPARHMGNLATLFAQKAQEVQKMLEPAPGAKQ